MVRLDNLFSRKTPPKAPAAQENGLGQADAGPTNLPPHEEQAMDRKSVRLERRELLYAVVRESMARVGMLSSSYKYKVLSLDSRGSQYLIMMDLPQDLAGQVDHLAEIEEVIAQNARMRHKIDVTAVYWRINPAAKNATLRKARSATEYTPPPQTLAPVRNETRLQAEPTAALMPGAKNKRFEPIRADEVNAFKQALAAGTKRPAGTETVPAHRSTSTDFPASEFPATEFEQTQLQDDDTDKNLPLSRTQYGDLI